MEPRCPICDVVISECPCDPKDRTIRTLENRVRMLEEANAAWRRSHGDIEARAAFLKDAVLAGDMDAVRERVRLMQEQREDTEGE